MLVLTLCCQESGAIPSSIEEWDCCMFNLNCYLMRERVGTSAPISTCLVNGGVHFRAENYYWAIIGRVIRENYSLTDGVDYVQLLFQKTRTRYYTVT